MGNFERYLKRNGLPVKLYLDKHSIYKSTAKPMLEDELNDVGPLREFEGALKELGVEVSHAHSPQTKGRIERLFRTPQDRLVKEMRLRGIRTIEEGNLPLEMYLPLYIRRGSVLDPRGGMICTGPQRRGWIWRRSYRIKTERALRNDFTVAHNGKLYQVEDMTKTSKVMLRDRIGGCMIMIDKGRSLIFKEIPERPPREKKEPAVARRRKPYIPPADHPRRRFKIGKHLYDREKLLESQM